VRGAHRFVLPGAQQGRAHLEGRLVYDAALLAWLKQFLDRIFPADPVRP
jgi:GMP synthase (glutamine-hydrolysing)